jgi:hypothetical protein
MVLAVVWAALRRDRFDVLFLTWTIPYFLLVSASQAKFMRYSAPLLPCLAIFCGRYMVHLFSSRGVAVKLGAVVTAFAALVYSGAYDAAYAQLFTRTDSRVAATQWVRQHASAGSYVELEELPDGLVNLPYYVTSAGFRPCFSQFRVAGLHSPAAYVLLDSYAVEEHPRTATSRVRQFEQALAADRAFRRVAVFRSTPSLLGWRFPIDASPHDWRYASHVITVYRNLAPTGYASSCFPNLQAAAHALYRPAGRS